MDNRAMPAESAVIMCKDSKKSHLWEHTLHRGVYTVHSNFPLQEIGPHVEGVGATIR